jgi:hypothetical protein
MIRCLFSTLFNVFVFVKGRPDRKPSTLCPTLLLKNLIGRLSEFSHEHLLGLAETLAPHFIIVLQFLHFPFDYVYFVLLLVNPLHVQFLSDGVAFVGLFPIV